MADTAYKRSLEFKNLADHIKERKTYIEDCQRHLFAYVGGQFIVETLKQTIETCIYICLKLLLIL